MKISKTASGTNVSISKEEWESIGKKAGWSTMANKRKRPQPTSQPKQEKPKDTDAYRGKGGPRKDAMPANQIFIDKKTKGKGKEDRRKSKYDLKRPESD